MPEVDGRHEGCEAATVKQVKRPNKSILRCSNEGIR